MKRYRFRLEQVQRVRRVQEDLAAAALGSAQRAEAEALRAQEARTASVMSRPRPHGVLDVASLLAQRAVWDAELADLRATEAARQDAAARTDEQRDAWLAASRRVKALELLDERRRDEHRAEYEREEAARVDDLVSGRYRSHREGAPA